MLGAPELPLTALGRPLAEQQRCSTRVAACFARKSDTRRACKELQEPQAAAGGGWREMCKPYAPEWLWKASAIYGHAPSGGITHELGVLVRSHVLPARILFQGKDFSDL